MASGGGQQLVRVRDGSRLAWREETWAEPRHVLVTREAAAAGAAGGVRAAAMQPQAVARI